MRQNWDYVSMPDYRADMKETADQAARAITFVRERAEKAERMLALVVLAAGEVSIHADMLFDPETKIELTTWRNDAAAPEMFAALEHLITDLEMKHPDLRLPGPIEARIRAVIAKATDRSGD